MASKKAGRLAGLAALAGLAYMNKDKLFGAKGETKAAAPAATEKSQTYAETAEDEDAEMGRLTRASQMRARGEAEGKKIDGSDRFAGPATTKDTEFGDLEGAMKRNAETTTPLTFGKAFRQARNAGDKTFTFNSKKYTTELAKPAAPAAPEAVETNKRGGVIKKMASGGMTSQRGDGIASKGKTRCKMY